MQKLGAEAIIAGADAVDPDALANQVRLFRSPRRSASPRPRHGAGC
jgi:hypothetical protein